jgi:hypothetical protein
LHRRSAQFRGFTRRQKFIVQTPHGTDVAIGPRFAKCQETGRFERSDGEFQQIDAPSQQRGFVAHELRFDRRFQAM